MKRKTFFIKGMHCPSCNILVEDKFKEVQGVREVKADFRDQHAEISYKGYLDKDALNSKIQQYGYKVVDSASQLDLNAPFLKRLAEPTLIAVIFLIAFFFFQELKILPSFDASVGLSLTVVFILGLVASVSTCMATSGALFLSTIGKLNSKQLSFKENLLPGLSFNIGRVLSYGFFGLIFGFLGKSIVQNFQLGAFFMGFLALFMIVIGLDMARIVSLAKLFNFGFTKSLFRRLEGKLIKNPKKTAFSLGAITYLLPCGFTQAVQLYAIGLADPWKSSLVMMIFALGTTPALLAIGTASSFTKSPFYTLFSKAMGVLVLIVGISYATNSLALYGINFDLTKTLSSDIKNVSLKNGVQEATMTVDEYGYSPSSFTVKKDVPVSWVVKGKNVFGCQGSLQAPVIGLRTTLSSGENVFTFTPKEKGLITFSCSMGMFRGNFLVI